MALSKMQLTTQLGTDFWNDSCDLRELSEACEHGAVGATSNPVIVQQVVAAERDTWFPVLDALVSEHTDATENDLAWALVEAVGRRAAAILAPVHERTEGRKGTLCVQVNPQFYRSCERMVEHGKRLASIAPNIAVKIPAVPAGLVAIERLTAAGVCINATVSFSIAQVLACADAVERGLAQARARGLDTEHMRPVITLMVGRIDDHLRRVMDRDAIRIDPGYVHWAGIAVFKKAYSIFQSRPYRSTLLAAAYRHILHWSELIGEHVVLSMPYAWWTSFNAASATPAHSITRPVPPQIVDSLYYHFADFRRAYDEDGMQAEEFVHYGPSVHTLQQFLGGYQQLLELVRQRMLMERGATRCV